MSNMHSRMGNARSSNTEQPEKTNVLDGGGRGVSPPLQAVLPRRRGGRRQREYILSDVFSGRQATNSENWLPAGPKIHHLFCILLSIPRIGCFCRPENTSFTTYSLRRRLPRRWPLRRRGRGPPPSATAASSSSASALCSAIASSLKTVFSATALDLPHTIM